MSVLGKTAIGDLPALTSSLVTKGLTLEKRSTSVHCATESSCGATTSPNTPRGTSQADPCLPGSKRLRN